MEAEKRRMRESNRLSIRRGVLADGVAERVRHFGIVYGAQSASWVATPLRMSCSSRLLPRSSSVLTSVLAPLRCRDRPGA